MGNSRADYMREYRKNKKLDKAENLDKNTSNDVNKRYYWLKLKADFFNQKVIKKLRKIAGGDTYTIIYLKMQLASLKNEGSLFFEGVENNFEEELALDLDEDIENVKVTLAYLKANNLIEIIDDSEFALTEVPNVIGSETASTIRSRKSRENKKMLQCNNDATALQQAATNCNTEIEKDKELKQELELEEDNDRQNTTLSSFCQVKDEENYLKFYLNNINPTASMYEIEKLKNWEEDLDPKLIIRAIEIALEKNKRNYAYINGVLNNWLKENVTTYEVWEARERIRAEDKAFKEQNVAINVKPLELPDVSEEERKQIINEF